MALLSDSPLWEAVPGGLALVDADGRLVATNGEFDELFGYDPGQLAGQPVDVLVPDSVRGHHARLMAGYLDQPMRRPLLQGGRLDGRRADGSIVPLLISLSPYPTEQGTFVVVGVRDIEALVAAERRLSITTRQQLLAEEQARIARDLHDTVIQEIYATGMQLELLRRAGEAPGPAFVEDTLDRLDRIIAHIRETIGDLKVAVGDRSMRGELARMMADLAPQFDAEPRLTVRGAVDDLDPSLAADLMAVARELVSNAARHASASSVEVRVLIDDRSVTVEVADDGSGFDPGSGRRSGLSNAGERAGRHGGSFDVRSGSRGTRAVWQVPRPPLPVT